MLKAHGRIRSAGSARRSLGTCEVLWGCVRACESNANEELAAGLRLNKCYRARETSMRLRYEVLGLRRGQYASIASTRFYRIRPAGVSTPHE